MSIHKKNSKNEYRTTDIYLTSFLIAAKHARLVRVESSGIRRKTFVLHSSPGEEILQSFYSKGESSKIVALDIMNELRNLKVLVMNQNTPKGGGNGEWS